MMSARRPRARQLELPIRTWGGARRGAGRPPNGARAGASHLRRAEHVAAHPVHVTLRAADGVPNLRGNRAFAAVLEALSRSEHEKARVVHFSVQSNHVHLIVEAASQQALSRLIQGLSIRIARAVNRALDRDGKVWGDRYHARPLRTPLEVHRALSYVLCNFQKHGTARGGIPLCGFMDGCSSAPWFEGWKLRDAAARSLGIHRVKLGERPVASPRTWLLRAGYKKHGLLDPDHVPARTPSKEGRTSH